MSNTAITRYENGENISLSRPPEMVLAEAQQAAQSLVKVIGMKPNPVKFNGETYLEFEDWQTVAKFYGCTSKVESTTFVEFGDVKGFEASAVVLDRLGNEIGRAESMCLNDEDNWGAVPKYEWQDALDEAGKKIYDKTLFNGKGGYKRNKVEVGRVPKPLFQLRSMAQTRACAKALRQVFSWVVVLAGYNPTPAEEIMEGQFGDQPQQQQQGSAKAAPQVQRKSQKSGGFPPVGAKPEPTICNECRQADGHAENCPYHPSNFNSEAAAAAQADNKAPAKAEGESSAEEKWKTYEGHDPKTHISFKQGRLLFVVQSGCGISEEDMKSYLKEHLKVEHRPLIPKNAFAPLLDAMDPDFKFHEAPKER